MKATTMRPGRRSLVGVAALSALFLVLSSGPAVADYPALKYYVNDTVGALTALNITDINDICVQVYERRGAEMAVLIVNSTAPDTIETYALLTFEKNTLGTKGKDDGLLLVIATGDHTWRIEVGAGLAGVLPDARVGRIADTYLVPALNVSDFSDGIFYTFAFLGQDIMLNYTAGHPPGAASPYPISWLPLRTWEIVLLAVVVVGVAVVAGGRILRWARPTSGRGDGGGSGGRPRRGRAGKKR